MGDTREWRDGRLFAVHWDFHAKPEDPEIGAGLTHEGLRDWVTDLRLDWVQCDCKGAWGLTSYPTKVGTPAPGLVGDLLALHRDVTHELGLPLVVHFLWHHDKHAASEHPDWQRRDAAGEELAGEICPLSPYVDELMIPLMMEIIDNYDVDGFWVDRSFWAAKPCWCDRCRATFPGTAPTSPAGEGWGDWLATHRANYLRQARKFVDAIHDRKPGCAVCINWAYSSMQPDPVEVPVDFLSGDLVGPFLLDWAPTEARLFDSRGLPWDLMPWMFTKSEPTFSTTRGWITKPAAQLCQEAAVLLSCGGGVQVYDQPRRDGGLVEAHRPVLKELADFCHARRHVVLGTRSVPQAAVLCSERSYYARNEPLFGRGTAWDPVEGALRALLANHVHVDLRNESDLLRDLEGFALVVLPECGPQPAELVARLAEYVSGGGRLLVTGDQGPAMWDLLGVRPTGAEPQDGYVAAGIDVHPFASGWLPSDLTGAVSLAPALAIPDPDTEEQLGPAITVRELGKGLVAAVPSDLFGPFWRNQEPGVVSLVGEVLAALDPALDVRAEARPYVHLSLRVTPRGYAVHLLNTSSLSPLSAKAVYTDGVAPSGPVRVQLRLDNPPADVRAVPSGDVRWEWAAGRLTAEVSEVGIHLAIEVLT